MLVPRRLLTISSLMLAGLAAMLLVACGSSGSGSGNSADQVLAQAFGPNKPINSGRLALTVLSTPKLGDRSGLTVSGPFENRGKGQVPAVDLAVALESRGQTLRVGLLSTGTEGFITFDGKTYALGADIFKRFAAGFSGAQRSATGAGATTTLSALGVDPRRWLTGAKLAGSEKVGGTDTIHIISNVRIPKLLTDLNTLLTRAGSSGLGAVAGQTAGTSITPAQLKQAGRSIRAAQVDIFVGKHDQTLRRLVVHMAVVTKAGQTILGFTTGQVAVDVTLTELNQPQTITAPTGAVPITDLQTKLQGLLGGLTGTGKAGSSKYQRCVRKAGQDIAALQKCAPVVGQ